jgi:hypothetical protein
MLFNIGFLVLQPVYVKDDFFDSLSCDALDRESRNGRTKFSEQLRKDSEVFLPCSFFPRARIFELKKVIPCYL